MPSDSALMGLRPHSVIDELESIANHLIVRIDAQEREFGRCLLYLLALHAEPADLRPIADDLQARIHALIDFGKEM